MVKKQIYLSNVHIVCSHIVLELAINTFSSYRNGGVVANLSFSCLVKTFLCTSIHLSSPIMNLYFPTTKFSDLNFTWQRRNVRNLFGETIENRQRLWMQSNLGFRLRFHLKLVDAACMQKKYSFSHIAQASSIHMGFLPIYSMNYENRKSIHTHSRLFTWK